MHIAEIDAFLSYFERIRARTVAIASLIPAESMEWSYRAGKFTLGDILRHLGAIERYMFTENAMGRPSTYPGHSSALMRPQESELDFLARMHSESVGLLSTLEPQDLARKCITPGGGSISVWKWLRAMIEHEIHHRGQIYLYLSMLGISGPPLFGLTEEEVSELGRATEG